jgi:hypothetical protein
VNSAQSETALIIVGLLAAGSQLTAVLTLLHFRNKRAPKAPTPPKTPAATSADVAPEAAADSKHLAAA